jgi:hypothetical protein
MRDASKTGALHEVRHHFFLAVLADNPQSGRVNMEFPPHVAL